MVGNLLRTQALASSILAPLTWCGQQCPRASSKSVTLGGTHRCWRGSWIAIPFMLIAVIPLIFAILGILMWVLATNPILKDAGRLMFFAGFLALMFAFSRQTITIGAAFGAEAVRALGVV